MPLLAASEIWSLYAETDQATKAPLLRVFRKAHAHDERANNEGTKCRRWIFITLFPPNLIEVSTSLKCWKLVDWITYVVVSLVSAILSVELKVCGYKTRERLNKFSEAMKHSRSLQRWMSEWEIEAGNVSRQGLATQRRHEGTRLKSTKLLVETLKSNNNIF